MLCFGGHTERRGRAGGGADGLRARFAGRRRSVFFRLARRPVSLISYICWRSP